MITRISLENFKGFSERVDIDLAPITLMYGANSSGKSSVFHALLYLYEVIENRWLDVDVSSLAPIDLGGYKNLVCNKNNTAPIRIEIAYDRDDSFDEVISNYGDYELEGEVDPLSYIADMNLSMPCGEYGVNCYVLSLEVSWSDYENKPYISKIDIAAADGPFTRSGPFTNGDCEHFATLMCDASLRNIKLTNINFDHYLMRPHVNEEGNVNDSFEDMVSGLCDNEGHLNSSELEIPLSLSGGAGALPVIRKPLPLILAEGLTDEIHSEKYKLYVKIDNAKKSSEIKLNQARYEELEAELKRIEVSSKIVKEFFSQGIVTPLEEMSVLLKNMIGIGPIREIPERNFLPRRKLDRNRWYTGLAAWDYLANCDEKAFNRISQWMFRLGTGYTLSKNEHGVVNLFDTSGASLHPQDVGIGISQLLPVVVGACHPDRTLLAVEQPELHIHPALQVELGDLLSAVLSKSLDLSHIDGLPEINEGMVSAMRERGALFLIETHSEHILLRLLRRIRETDEGELEEKPWLKLFPDDVAVNYFDRKHEGTVVSRLRIDETGEFIDRWPKGFFGERAEELF